METPRSKIGIVSLGCARNLVDSQRILGYLKARGHVLADVDDADIVILNTCSFVEDARQESIDTLLELIDLKKQGKIKKIIMAGCMPQRYGQELIPELKEVDAFMGIQDFSDDVPSETISLTPRHFSYVKICESCYNHCGFCAIPSIKGAFVSRKRESIVEEVRGWDARGVKEINIIGQDITAYGMDLCRKKALAELLRTLAREVRSIEWIRLLYTFPAHITDELIDVVAQEAVLCKYMDVPLQHISDAILTRMNRNFSKKETVALLKKLRDRIPGCFLRTSFIVGMPGETERDFEELAGFVEEMRFEKAGVFKYSREEGTPAYDMPGQVPEDVKQKRFDRLMQVQQAVSQSVQEGMVGQTLKVLVDSQEEQGDNMYTGRTEYDAPDVDGLVTIYAKQPLTVGEFAQVRITGATEYDLMGEA